jgi:hypothetical protein
MPLPGARDWRKGRGGGPCRGPLALGEEEARPACGGSEPPEGGAGAPAKEGGGAGRRRREQKRENAVEWRMTPGRWGKERGGEGV